MILTTHDMQDIEALTGRILLIGKGRLLLDGNLEELKKHISPKKTLHIKYQGKTPRLFEGIVLLEEKMDDTEAMEGQMKLSLDPGVLSVSAAIAALAEQTNLLDVSVTDITAEEMVAALYKEYEI